MNFKMGQIVVTKRIADRIKADKSFNVFIRICIGRYVREDWGDLDEEDKQTNNAALKNGERILAAYKRGKDEVWIITEADRECTTILFPDEY